MNFSVITRIDAANIYPYVELSFDEGFTSSPSSRSHLFKTPDWIHAGQTGHYHLASEPFDGRLRLTCPQSGITLVSEYGLVQTTSGWVDIVYSFKSESLGRIYLYTSSFDQCKLALVLPKDSVVVLSGLWGNIVKSTLLDVLNIAYKDFHRSNNDYFGVENTACPIDTFAAYQSNLGHYFWNDLAGLLNLVSACEGVQIRLNLGPHQYLPARELLDFPFPNHIEVAETQRFTWHKYPRPLRVPGQRIGIQLRKRVIKYAILNSSTNWRDLNRTTFVLLFNVRSHNKVWRNQVDGVKVALNAIASRFRGVRVTLIIDGTPDCKKVVREIENTINREHVDLIDGTDISISDSICYALVADLAISCVGSGLALSSWLAGTKSLAHGNLSHLSQKTFWNFISETDQKVSFLSYGSVKAEDDSKQGNSRQNSGASYADYDVDTTALEKALENLLEEMNLGPKRAAFTRAKEFLISYEYDQALSFLI